MGGGIFRSVPESSMSGLESAEQASGVYREVGASCMSGLESGGGGGGEPQECTGK